MNVEISVTAEDIANGIPGDCRFCPVAQAIRRQVPGGFVHAFTDTLWTSDVTATTPQEVADFIRAFDRDEPVAPFTFTADFR